MCARAYSGRLVHLLCGKQGLQRSEHTDDEVNRQTCLGRICAHGCLRLFRERIYPSQFSAMSHRLTFPAIRLDSAPTGVEVYHGLHGLSRVYNLGPTFCCIWICPATTCCGGRGRILSTLHPQRNNVTASFIAPAGVAPTPMMATRSGMGFWERARRLSAARMTV